VVKMHLPPSCLPLSKIFWSQLTGKEQPGKTRAVSGEQGPLSAATSTINTNYHLSRAIIHEVTVLENNTSIDEAAGIHIDGLPGLVAAMLITGEGRVAELQEFMNM
jgi:hypothetical protein